MILRGDERILIVGTEIGRSLTDFADGFRRLGFHVAKAIRQRNPQHPSFKYDFELTDPIRPERIFTTPWARLRRYPFEVMQRRRLLSDYDIYIFLFGQSLLPKNKDFPILRRRNRKLVSVFCGDDVRHYSAAAPQFEAHGVPYSPHYLARSGHRKLADQMRKLRMAELYSDVILSQPNQAGLAIRPYHHYYLPVDLSLYQFYSPARDVPIVVHAPSHRGVKGTEIILATLESFKQSGLPFELRLFEHMPNAEVLRNLTNADVVADQLYFPLYGFFAMEAMASGCAVATGNNYSLEPIPPDRPVHPVSPATFESHMRLLLSDKELRAKLACQGREFVEKHHSHTLVCQYVLDCLTGKIAPQHHTTWFAEHFSPPTGEIIPRSLQNITTQLLRQHSAS